MGGRALQIGNVLLKKKIIVAQYRRSPSIFSFFVNNFLYVHLLYHIFCVQRAAVLTLEYWDNYAGAHIWLMNSPGIGPFARQYQFPCVRHSSPTQYENHHTHYQRLSGHGFQLEGLIRLG